MACAPCTLVSAIAGIELEASSWHPQVKTMTHSLTTQVTHLFRLVHKRFDHAVIFNTTQTTLSPSCLKKFSLPSRTIPTPTGSVGKVMAHRPCQLALINRLSRSRRIHVSDRQINARNQSFLPAHRLHQGKQQPMRTKPLSSVQG